MDDCERADFLGWLLEVWCFDEVTRFAPKEEDAAHACGEPQEPYTSASRFGFAPAVLLFPLVMQDEEFAA